MLFPSELILAAHLALFLLRSYGSATCRSSAMYEYALFITWNTKCSFVLTKWHSLWFYVWRLAMFGAASLTSLQNTFSQIAIWHSLLNVTLHTFHSPSSGRSQTKEYNNGRDLSEDGHLEAETCRRHIVKLQTIVECCWQYHCIKCCVFSL